MVPVEQEEQEVPVELEEQVVPVEQEEQEVPVGLTKRVIIEKPNSEVNLLPITTMIICKLIILWTTEAVHATLRRGWSDDVFVLMNLFGQCPKWHRQLHIHFTDFEKAFDSIHSPQGRSHQAHSQDHIEYYDASSTLS